MLLHNSKGLVLRLSDSPRRVDAPALTVGSMAQFYHQTVEFLSRLAVVDHFQLGHDRPLVVNADLADFQLQQLALLGYGESRLIRVGADEQVVFQS